MTRRNWKKAAVAALGLSLCATGGGTYAQTVSATPALGAAVGPSVSPVTQTSTAETGDGAGDTVSTRAVHDFTMRFGVPVVQSTTTMQPTPVDSSPPTPRLRQIQSIAAADNVGYRKVYLVSPADTDKPVTTVADARRMVDQGGTVSLNNLTEAPQIAIRRVAAADNAIVEFQGFNPQTDISVNMNSETLPQAIADLAIRTHTHWAAEYMLAPIAGVTATPSRVAIAAAPSLSQQQYEATQLFNGPITIHISPSNVNTVPSAATAAAAAVSASGAQPVSPVVNPNQMPAYPNNGMLPSSYYNPYTGSFAPAPTVDPYGGNEIVNGGTPTNTTF